MKTKAKAFDGQLATLKTVRALAHTIGATVDWSDGIKVAILGVEAPAGHVWLCDGDIHELIASAEKPFPMDFDDVVDRMKHGVGPCPMIPNCEWCNPETIEKAAE